MMSSKPICSVPFYSLIINANGKIGTCRELGTDHVIGDITVNTIEEIWNGEKIQKLRREHLEGYSPTCNYFIETKKCHQLIANRKYEDEVELGEIVPLSNIKRFSAGFNGQCNLKCPICFVWKFTNGLYDRLNFWPTFEKNILPFISEIDFLSGEPFIQKDTYRLIDLVAKINPRCKFKFTTNGHWLLNEKVERALDKVDVELISISIDSIDRENYKKVRTGRLDIVLENIERLQKYNEKRAKKSNPFLLQANFTIFNENWHEVPTLLRYFNERKIKTFVQLLYEPKWFSILEFDENKKDEILKFYFNQLSDREVIQAHRVIVPLIDSIQDEKKEYYRNFYRVITNGFFQVTKNG